MDCQLKVKQIIDPRSLWSSPALLYIATVSTVILLSSLLWGLGRRKSAFPLCMPAWKQPEVSCRWTIHSWRFRILNWQGGCLKVLDWGSARPILEALWAWTWTQIFDEKAKNWSSVRGQNQSNSQKRLMK